MIFYHVLAHIDFFQNNKFFKYTWDYDFKEKALTEKRIIAKLRAKKNRQVDYIIEFSRSMDNLIGFFDTLSQTDEMQSIKLPSKIDYYFNVFLQKEINLGMNDFLEEISRYDTLREKENNKHDDIFILSLNQKYPEFENFYDKNVLSEAKIKRNDLMQFIMEESTYLNQEENRWMKSVIDIIRDTSLYFAPMIRTKTMNEGWASYWHEKLFMNDDRIIGNEVAFARINAKVTSLSKVGLNPYAIGWRLFMHIEELADKGMFNYDFTKIQDLETRKTYDKNTGIGRDFIFHIRENYCDLTFLNRFIEQDFVDRYKLMVVGQRINHERQTREYYVKSRKAGDYKKMITGSLYHPPFVKYSVNDNGELYINHIFEEKELYREYINNTLIGLEYLWGKPVILETTEIDWEETRKNSKDKNEKDELVTRRVKYTSRNRTVIKESLI
jgi:stage V sporulation protein R